MRAICAASSGWARQMRSARPSASSVTLCVDPVLAHLAREALARETDRLGGAGDVPTVLAQLAHDVLALEGASRVLQARRARTDGGRAAHRLREIVRRDARTRCHEHEALIR